PSLGGRPTVGPQTLDLLIGVRIPASQPIRIIKKIRENAGVWKFISLHRIGSRYVWDKRPGYFLSSGGTARNENAREQDRRQARPPKPNAGSRTNSSVNCSQTAKNFQSH